MTGGNTASPSVDGLNRGHIAHRSHETNFRNEAAQQQAAYCQRELQQQADKRLRQQEKESRQQQQEESRQTAASETALNLASQWQAVFDELVAQEALRQQQMAEQARMLQNLYNDHIYEQQIRELEQEEQRRQQEEEEQVLQRQQEEEAHQVRLEVLRFQQLENKEIR